MATGQRNLWESDGRDRKISLDAISTYQDGDDSDCGLVCFEEDSAPVLHYTAPNDPSAPDDSSGVPTLSSHLENLDESFMSKKRKKKKRRKSSTKDKYGESIPDRPYTIPEMSSFNSTMPSTGVVPLLSSAGMTNKEAPVVDTLPRESDINNPFSSSTTNAQGFYNAQTPPNTDAQCGDPLTTSPPESDTVPILPYAKHYPEGYSNPMFYEARLSYIPPVGESSTDPIPEEQTSDPDKTENDSDKPENVDKSVDAPEQSEGVDTVEKPLEQSEELEGDTNAKGSEIQGERTDMEKIDDNEGEISKESENRIDKEPENENVNSEDSKNIENEENDSVKSTTDLVAKNNEINDLHGNGLDIYSQGNSNHDNTSVRKRTRSAENQKQNGFEKTCSTDNPKINGKSSSPETKILIPNNKVAPSQGKGKKQLYRATIWVIIFIFLEF